VILQNCFDLLKDVPGSCSERGATFSDDGDRAISVKVEEVTDLQEVEDPVSISCLLMKCEHEVS
jgi:hypothetical protein